MYYLLVVLASSFLVTYITTPVLIRKFKSAGLTGRDMSKPNKPTIAEMGGLTIVAGFVMGVLIAVALYKLSAYGFPDIAPFELSLVDIFATLTTILTIVIIGVFDDLVSIKQSVKAILPIFAALPLVAVAAGHPYITLPFLGELYLPFIYPLILIPIGITGASNATNMLAGFNGLEAGLGVVACSSVGITAIMHGNTNAPVLMFAMVGALLAFLRYNWHPARVFPGDVGNLSIGAAIACAVIIDNFEIVGLIVIAPYIVDFIIKVYNKFPKEVDFIKVKRDGKLTTSKILGLPSLIMRLSGGITERRLVICIIGIEVIFGALAILK